MWKRIGSFALAAALVFAAAGCAKQQSSEQVVVKDQIPVAAQTGTDAKPDTDGEAEPKAPAKAEKVRQATLYYMDTTGCTVPVSRDIPWTEGIAKATLGYLVDTQSDAVLQGLGLKAPLPKGTELELDIADGKATVDVKLPEKGFESKEQESAAIAAMVNTLLEFPTVKSVTFLFNGKS